MHRFLLLLALTGLSLLAAAHVEAAGPAGSPGILTIRVINDLNENGVEDAGEPGLADWGVQAICGDVYLFYGETNADGVFVHENRYGGLVCLSVRMEFGWLPTSPPAVDVIVPVGSEAEVVFLARHVGTDVEGFSGIAIAESVPASGTAALDAIVDGTICSDQVAGERSGYSYELYVLGAAERAGCAEEGDEVAFTIDGIAAGTATFHSGERAKLDLIAGPPPMYFWFWYYGVDAQGPVVPLIGSNDCGTAVLEIFGGLPPPNYQAVFVAADAQQPGCGLPGRVVDLEADGHVVAQVIWMPGRMHYYRLQYLGDPDCNRTVDSVDSAIILQYVAGLVAQLGCPMAADTSRDGATSAVDAALVLQLAADLIDYFA